jgi:tetratricopeptide (TPR) repeat protein
MTSEYARLIAAYRQGRLASIDPHSLVPRLSPVLSLLFRYTQRDWQSFDAALWALDGEAYAPIRGDLRFLEATSYFFRAEYARAGQAYEQASASYGPGCLLYNPELISYNLYVVRTFAPDFSFGRELSRLARARKGARLKGDASLVALILNAYGNHAHDRGQFARALRLFKAAVAWHEKSGDALKLNNYLDSLGNAVRAAAQSGELAEAGRLVQSLNARVLATGDSVMKERFDRVYAEYLYAAERHDESLMHLDFSIHPGGAFETARLLLLKARLLLITGAGRAGADESLTLLGQAHDFIVEHGLKEDSLTDYHATLAWAQMTAGDQASAYRSILKAETLAYAHHRAHLRAEVVLMKARLNRLQGKTGSAARIAVEALRSTTGHGFGLLTMQALRELARPELAGALEDADRALVARAIGNVRDEALPPRAREAVVTLRALLGSAGPRPAPGRAAGGASLLARDEPEGHGIYYRDAGGEERLLCRAHRMTGKLLQELMAAPNRDLGFDHLHQRLWGGPIRNESHLQKLKTLVSRVRSELHEQGVPAEIESREYATYRLVTALAVVTDDPSAS